MNRTWKMAYNKAVTTMKTHYLKQLTFSVLGLIACGQASAVVIDDNYWGADGFTSLSDRDSIGGNDYQIQNMEVTFAGGYMNVRVNTNFFEPDPYGVQFGDLFISSNGWNPDTSALNYRNDNIFTGESWEYVFDTSEGALYGGAFDIATSDDFFAGQGYYYRRNQEVQRANGGTALAGSLVDASAAGVGGYVEYNILLSSLNLTAGDIGLRWAMTCANDAIEGAVHYSVPEPATILMFGLGIMGLGMSARKTRTK
jgi:hypothetical protein